MPRMRLARSSAFQSAVMRPVMRAPASAARMGRAGRWRICASPSPMSVGSMFDSSTMAGRATAHTRSAMPMASQMDLSVMAAGPMLQ